MQTWRTVTGLIQYPTTTNKGTTHRVTKHASLSMFLMISLTIRASKHDFFYESIKDEDIETGEGWPNLSSVVYVEWNDYSICIAQIYAIDQKVVTIFLLIGLMPNSV